MNAKSNIDPFLLEVLKNTFDTIADDMALNLMRSAYSGIIRDSMDFSTALLDHRGQTLAQGLTTPMHLGSFYDAMTGLIAHFGADVDPKDVFIFNDPYVANGQHLPDIYIVKPIYDGADLTGWSCAVAHHCDVGGIVAGSNALGASEIYQEGLRIPFLKFIDAGTPSARGVGPYRDKCSFTGQGHGRSAITDGGMHNRRTRAARSHRSLRTCNCNGVLRPSSRLCRAAGTRGV